MIFKEDTVEVLREVEAALIPSGVSVTLQKGTFVAITQSLGTSYTVYVNGNLVRISGKDGDALGMMVLEELDVNFMEGSLEDKIWEMLKTCYDPEIPVNIVDLGLVYECHISPLAEGGHFVSIKMTLTAAGCGMGPVLIADVQEKIRKFSDVNDVNVELVFDPPWDRDKMSDVAKLQLGVL